MKRFTKLAAEIIPYLACIASGFGFGWSLEHAKTKEILRNSKAVVEIAQGALQALGECRTNAQTFSQDAIKRAWRDGASHGLEAWRKSLKWNEANDLVRKAYRDRFGEEAPE